MAWHDVLARESSGGECFGVKLFTAVFAVILGLPAGYLATYLATLGWLASPVSSPKWWSGRGDIVLVHRGSTLAQVVIDLHRPMLHAHTDWFGRHIRIVANEFD